MSPLQKVSNYKHKIMKLKLKKSLKPELFLRTEDCLFYVFINATMRKVKNDSYVVNSAVIICNQSNFIIQFSCQKMGQQTSSIGEHNYTTFPTPCQIF